MADALACPHASWRALPLASQPTPLAELTTAALVDWARSIAAHSSGSLAALLLAALLLLGFATWRLALCCTSCCCPARRPRLPRSGGKGAGAAAEARRILRGRGARCLKAALLLCALGVLGGCIYGLTQTRTTVVPGALGVLRQAEQLADGALDAGDGLLQSLTSLDAAALAVVLQLEAAGPAYAPATQQQRQQLGSTREQLGAAAAALQDALAALRPDTLGRMQQAEADYLSLAQSGETMLQGALYAVFSLLAAVALLTAVGAAADWPALAKPALSLLLLLALLTWVLDTAATVTLRAGNDACASLEPLLLNLSGGGPLVQYLLTGQGGSLLGALAASGHAGLDVDGAVAAATGTLDALQAAAQAWPPELAAAVLPAVDDAAAAVEAVLGRLSELEGATSYAAVHAVYAAAKSLACCSALDATGRLFAALLSSGSCALAATLLAFVWLGRIDRLGDRGCCHIHSPRDWSVEAQREADGAGRGSSGDEAAVAAAVPAAKAFFEVRQLDMPINLKQPPSAPCDHGPSAPPSPTIRAARSESTAAGGGLWAGLHAGITPAVGPHNGLVLRSLSLPPARPAALSDPQPALPPPPAVGVSLPPASETHHLPPLLEAEADGSLGQEASAPPLPAAEGEPSLEQVEATARAAAELAGAAFTAAARASSMLNDAARLARASLRGQAPAAGQPGTAGLPPPQQQAAAAGGRGGGGAQQARVLERQPSRIPGPYLNY